MTCYLTDGADPAELARGKSEGVWVAAKLYPAHATTNSAHGVTSMDAIARGLEAMEKAGMPLLVHGEVTDPEVDIFDREAVFLDKVLAPLIKRHPGLKYATIAVEKFETLLIKFAEQVGASVIVRGLRAVSDFEYEFQMVGINQRLNRKIETVFLMADPRHQAIASRLVKEIAMLGGDIGKLTTPYVAELLVKRCKELRKQ